MKKIYLIFWLVILCTITLYSQNLIKKKKVGENRYETNDYYSNPFNNVSPMTASLLLDIQKQGLEKLKSNKELKSKYLIRDSKDGQYVYGIFQINEGFSENLFKDLKIKINSKIGNFWTYSILIEDLFRLIEFREIKYLQIDEPVYQKLDNARASTWVDEVHQGISLPQSIKGNGVIVGVIDGGFDYTHPTFLDQSGTTLRISKVWNTKDNFGTPPTGFSYGSEYVGQVAILNEFYSINTKSHGTHVAGIAAGSGFGTNGTFLGVAPESEIVLVQTGGGNFNGQFGGNISIIDGIKYIFDFAQSIGKPAVINLSLGTHIGSHDGSSIVDQTFNSLVGNGKILVGAAGNEGDTPLHASHSFSNDTVQTIVYFESGTNNGMGGIDIWGSPYSQFTYAINIFDVNGNYQAYTPYLYTSNNGSIDTIFQINSNSIHVKTICQGNSPLNHKPNVSVAIDNPSQSYFATIELTSQNSTLHLWNNGLGTGAKLTSYFPGLGYQPNWLDGNTDYTVGEIGGTASGVISVGAYSSKNSWTALNGSSESTSSTIDNIASFSSKGPTVDWRTKPDITAPGDVVVSSVNSWDNNYPSSSYKVVSQVTIGGENWYYAEMDGTSMASPMVSGIVALMLQVNPALNPSQTLQYIKNNAWTDSYTGTIPANGSNTWGWGKIDAHETIKSIVNDVTNSFSVNVTASPSSICINGWTQLNPNSVGGTGTNSYSWSSDPSGFNSTDSNPWVSPTVNTTYTVTVTTGVVKKITSVTVNVTNIPTPVISANNNLLTSDATSGNQWYVDNNLISGATSTTYTPIQNGNFYVIVSQNGCSSTQSNIIYFTDVEEITANSNFKVYPNPVNQNLYIETLKSNSKLKFEIYNSIGQMVYSSTVNKKTIVDISHFANGFYDLNIYDGRNVYTKRLIKE